ncbi:uncharacterized protein [Anabrus simplex]|uniref:uncharacterized protein isoform X2 n=1 Tax=Anabrus simplex TaxID=316456 RepID=UPI0035A29253
MMDDEEQEDLLVRASSDNEDFTDNEDGFDICRKNILNSEKTSDSCYERLQFIFTGVVLIISSTVLLILLPLYLETVNAKSDAYTALLFTCLGTTTVLFVIGCVTGRFLNGMKPTLSMPFSLSKVYRSGTLCGISGFLIVYALDRKRVMCHIQDPIKGIVLVFSLVYYFFFCRKMMGLQQIFCSTTIVVGLFVSVDYGLCDEFRCRGNEREHRSEDAGYWSWKIHSSWTVIYIIGLALWSLHHTLLEGLLVTHGGVLYTGPGGSLLATVSRLVSTRDTHSSSTVRHSRPLLQAADEERERDMSSGDQQRQIAYMKPHHNSGPRPCALSIALWNHFVSLQILLTLCWTDMIPVIGKGSSAHEFWTNLSTGILCHFGYESYHQNSTVTLLYTGAQGCNHVTEYAWPFLAAYVVFAVSSMHFLILSESSVFTVAMTTAALPLGSIWWSLFRMNMHEGGHAQKHKGATCR